MCKLWYYSRPVNMFEVMCSAMILVAFIQISDLLGTIPNQARQNCQQNTIQLRNLLSDACGKIQDVEACRRNFMMATRGNNNQPSIQLLALYADVYFGNSQYAECLNIIATATSTNGVCESGYCGFVRCIRRINSDVLISQCYLQASLNNPAELQADQVILYKNITSCILATARCSAINPITGQPQSNSFIRINTNTCGRPVYSTVHIYNALQINPAGDLRILTLPGTAKIQSYLCPYEVNYRETSWMNFNC